MNKLASHSIWAISIGAEFFAELGFVKDGDVGFDHHPRLSMSE